MISPLTENLISYLVLAYNRPQELYNCLQSIRHNTKFDHQIIVCANGGQQDYYWQFYNQGLIDKLILRKTNGGLGIGTIELFNACDTEFGIYFQEDQFLGRVFAKEELDKITKLLVEDPCIRCVSIAGNTNQNMYSERAHVINTQFYNSIPNKSYFGAGPFHNGEWNESIVNKYFQSNNFKHFIWPTPLVIDNGHSAVRENPDGSIWKHYPDTKELWLLKGPVKERFIYPSFTDLEWETVLNTQNWPPGQIPENEKSSSFRCWNR